MTINIDNFSHIEICAPFDYEVPENVITIFLGGSIDMGAAENWQQKVINHFDNLEYDNVLFYNPRRKDWDSTWLQHPSNSQFSEQVNWEMDKQEKCNIKLYYFADNSVSPITLLELGKYANEYGNTIVYCSDKYFRYGNVAMFCDRYRISHTETFEDFILTIEKKIKEISYD